MTDFDCNVTISENTIMFYDEVNEKTALILNECLESVQRISYNPIANGNVILRINSGGGSILDALSVVGYIERSDVPVCSVVEGICASAATLISLSAQKRLINRHSFMLIHQLSNESWGTFTQVQDNSKNCTKVMDLVVNYYLKHTTLKRKQLKRLLKRDLYLDAKECLEYGLVDGII